MRIRNILLLSIFSSLTYSVALPPPHHLRSADVYHRLGRNERETDIATDDKDERDKNRVPIDDFPNPQDLRSIINFTQSTEGAIQACTEETAPGRSHIYCSGKLLEAVMATQLYKDSKTFVDRPLKFNHTGEEVYQDFLELFPQDIRDISKSDLLAFVNENFDEEGHELQECELTDWQKQPATFQEIMDPALRKFAYDLNEIWKVLCRKVNPAVAKEPERFSLLYVPENFIIPGGRFREYYYWDAYWIVRGLISSGMLETTRNMLRNFQYLVDTIGFIPNGGRVYYLQRSQPPLFAAMVYEYYTATMDKAFIREVLPSLEKEFDYWKKNRTVNVHINGTEFEMFQYRTPTNVPRPESFREDVHSAQNFTSLTEKRKFWHNIASAAESGWDFSSRWFADKKNITTIESTNILPVDLNAFLCYNLNIMSYLHAEIGNENKELNWMRQYIQFRDDFKKVFYVEKEKGWYDFNTRTMDHNLDFYPSMAIPLFTGCYDRLATRDADELYNKMADMGAFNFVGGIPTSLNNGTQQQWDFPNGWSPLNHMVIEGLRKSGNPRMQRKAFSLAEKWVVSNYRVFDVNKAMWEKYDVSAGRPSTGSGGEYDVQAGFGWTNGVILDLLYTYGDRMRCMDLNAPIIPAISQQPPDSLIQNDDDSSSARIRLQQVEESKIDDLWDRDTTAASGTTKEPVNGNTISKSDDTTV